MIKNFRDWWRD